MRFWDEHRRQTAGDWVRDQVPCYADYLHSDAVYYYLGDAVDGMAPYAGISAGTEGN